MLHQEACHLLPNVRSETLAPRKKAITLFTKRIRLTHCAATNTAQKNLQETEEV
jgi:hypothetical protein